MSRRRSSRRNNYGAAHLLLDVILTLCTGGLWLIVVLIRFLGRNS